jgi:hypothetical protein
MGMSGTGQWRRRARGVSCTLHRATTAARRDTLASTGFSVDGRVPARKGESTLPRNYAEQAPGEAPTNFGSGDDLGTSGP